MKRIEFDIQTQTSVEVTVLSYSDGLNILFLDEGIDPPIGYNQLSDAEIDSLNKVSQQNYLIKESLDLIQSYLDTHAQSWGYDDIKSAVTYADEPSVLQFQNEGKALRAWRSLVWEQASLMLSIIESGQSPIPTKADILDSLPAKPERP